MTEDFNNDTVIDNIRYMLAMESLGELPHWSTINDYLKRLNPNELEQIIPKLVKQLIRMHTFDDSRIRNKYWQIIVDVTELYNTNERHCLHCLTRKHKDKAGNLIWTEYYHCVLESKLIIHDNVVIIIATEFIENEAPNVFKQDCERNAFYRLAKKLKGYFPRLSLCIGGGSLYACGPVFDICKQNNWNYLIRFKDGSLPSVAEEFHALKDWEPDQTFKQIINGVSVEYRFVRDILYKTNSLNIVEYASGNQTYPFVFITDLPVSKRTYQQTVQDVRRRWKIENQGFNAQKNHGFELEHLFSEDHNAMKNHYLLIQMGHMIDPLYQQGIQILTDNRLPDYAIIQMVKLAFGTFALSSADNLSQSRKVRYRFH